MDLDDKPSCLAPQADRRRPSRSRDQPIASVARGAPSQNTPARSLRSRRQRCRPVLASPELHRAYRTNFTYYFNTFKLV